MFWNNAYWYTCYTYHKVSSLAWQHLKFIGCIVFPSRLVFNLFKSTMSYSLFISLHLHVNVVVLEWLNYILKCYYRKCLMETTPFVVGHSICLQKTYLNTYCLIFEFKSCKADQSNASQRITRINQVIWKPDTNFRNNWIPRKTTMLLFVPIPSYIHKLKTCCTLARYAGFISYFLSCFSMMYGKHTKHQLQLRIHGKLIALTFNIL